MLFIFSESCDIVIKEQLVCRFMAWDKKIFYECVACVCFTFGTIFLVIAFSMAIGFLVGVMTISYAQPIVIYKTRWMLDIKKWLVFKDFIIKDTKLLS